MHVAEATGKRVIDSTLMVWCSATPSAFFTTLAGSARERYCSHEHRAKMGIFRLAPILNSAQPVQTSQQFSCKNLDHYPVHEKESYCTSRERRYTVNTHQQSLRRLKHANRFRTRFSLHYKAAEPKCIIPCSRAQAPPRPPADMHDNSGLPHETRVFARRKTLHANSISGQQNVAGTPRIHQKKNTRSPVQTCSAGLSAVTAFRRSCLGGGACPLRCTSMRGRWYLVCFSCGGQRRRGR